MDHLADSIAKLSQGRENWYIGRKGIPVDDSSGEKCEPVIVFECMDLSIGQRLNVSGLSCVSNKVLRCSDSSFFVGEQNDRSTGFLLWFLVYMSVCLSICKASIDGTP